MMLFINKCFNCEHSKPKRSVAISRKLHVGALQKPNLHQCQNSSSSYGFSSMAPVAVASPNLHQCQISSSSYGVSSLALRTSYLLFLTIVVPELFKFCPCLLLVCRRRIQLIWSLEFGSHAFFYFFTVSLLALHFGHHMSFTGSIQISVHINIQI